MGDAHKRPRGRPKSVDREHAAAAAMDNYWRLGLAELSLNEVCRRAGISKPALYREFGGEDGLQAAALDAYRAQVIEPMLAGLGAPHPFPTVLDGAIVALTSGRDAPPGCLLTKMRLSLDRLGPDTTAKVRALEALQRDAYEAWFSRAVDEGEANPDLAPAFAARYIDTQFTTILVQMDLGMSGEDIRAQTRLAVQPLLASP